MKAQIFKWPKTMLSQIVKPGDLPDQPREISTGMISKEWWTATCLRFGLMLVWTQIMTSFSLPPNQCTARRRSKRLNLLKSGRVARIRCYQPYSKWIMIEALVLKEYTLSYIAFSILSQSKQRRLCTKKRRPVSPSVIELRHNTQLRQFPKRQRGKNCRKNCTQLFNTVMAKWVQNFTKQSK